METCGATGAWTVNPVVANVCNAVCNPTAKQCSGNGVATCGSTGLWGAVTQCAATTPYCKNGTCASPASCAASGMGTSVCGPSGETCCQSVVVPGGSFYRSYDGISTITTPATDENQDCCTHKAFAATLSPFRLDRYEVTLGRFRQFVSAVVGGYLPPAGSGKHTHLNGGNGLNNSSSAGNTEQGWQTAWNGNMATTQAGWNSNLTCPAPAGVAFNFPTWTPSVGSSENLPINCVNWYEAYAFCIWDGGFLPSQAEWNFAASGGSEQRVYPWSNPPSNQGTACGYVNTFGDICSGSPAPVGAQPSGDGKYLQKDLSGNVAEWVIDNFGGYGPMFPTSCNDCAALPAFGVSDNRLYLGGGIYIPITGATADTDTILSSNNFFDASTLRDQNIGVRCARSP
jgi:formylglycine-generating enzyme required for sulfatase activity